MLKSGAVRRIQRTSEKAEEDKTDGERKMLMNSGESRVDSRTREALCRSLYSDMGLEEAKPMSGWKKSRDK